ncbi:PhoH family protein [Megasphaera sp.]|mgnify:CR=1 FL=1|uniref:PhoH family protein n=1 Tax=Megasphaera sp. TaxID=2023260 RepID=UPI004026DDFB
MAKTYVLDTNVLIQAPYAMQCFEDNHVVIPLVVVEELDGLKKADGERGFNARQAIRFLERLRLRGNLLDGVPLDNGGTLRIEINCVHEALPDSLPDDQADNRILKVCRHLQQCQPILVTKDLVLRLKAQVLNIEAQDFSREQVLPEKNAYAGRLTCYVPEAAFNDFLTQGVAVSQLYLTDRDGRSYAPEVQENEFVILQADASLRKTHLGRVHQGRVLPLTYSRVTPYGIKPHNAGQYFMQEALMRPIIDNLEQLIDSNKDERYDNERELAEKIEEIFDRQLIQTEALNFVRGRSLEKTYLIIDEAQNMTPNQVKGIITRAGKGTKIILVGDPNQIDKPFLDERTNGLTYAAGKMKGSPLCYQLTMMADECERSPLTLDAIQRL